MKTADSSTSLSCAQVFPDLERFWRDELSPALADQVQAHVNACDHCADVLAARLAPRSASPLGSAGRDTPDLRPPDEAFRGYWAAHQGRIGPSVPHLQLLAAQGDHWAQEMFAQVRVALGQRHLDRSRQEMPGRELQVVVLSEGSWMPTGEWATFEFKQLPTIDTLGKIVLTAQTLERSYLGAMFVCTMCLRPGSIISLHGSVTETSAGLLEAHISEPMLEPAKEELQIPANALQFYLIPAARQVADEIIRTIVLTALGASVVHARGVGVVRTRGASRAGSGQEERAAWDLVTDARAAEIALPSELAQKCYGTTQQTVRLRLLRQSVPGQTDRAFPKLVISPAPRKAVLRCRLRFLGGEERDLIIPRHAARSLETEPVSASAFGAAQWKLELHLLNSPVE